MTCIIHIFDGNEERVKAWFKRIVRISPTAVVFSRYRDGSFDAWQCGSREDHVTFTRKEVLVPNLILAHGNDCNSFDKYFHTADQKRVIWYGGFPGYWFDYPALKQRNKACRKIFGEIPGGSIPLSDMVIAEIIEYASGIRSDEQVSCIHAPSDAGLLLAVSIIVQSELSAQHEELEAWIEIRELSKHVIPDSVRNFQKLAKGLEAKVPEKVNWLVFLEQHGLEDGKAIMDEAIQVSRSLGHSPGEQKRLCQSIQQLFTEIQKGTGGPSIETLSRVYDALYILEKEGKER